MIIPIRCFTCAALIAHKWNLWHESMIEGLERDMDRFKRLNIVRFCCRRMFLQHTNLIDSYLSQAGVGFYQRVGELSSVLSSQDQKTRSDRVVIDLDTNYSKIYSFSQQSTALASDGSVAFQPAPRPNPMIRVQDMRQNGIVEGESGRSTLQSTHKVLLQIINESETLTEVLVDRLSRDESVVMAGRTSKNPTSAFEILKLETSADIPVLFHILIHTTKLEQDIKRMQICFSEGFDRSSSTPNKNS